MGRALREAGRKRRDGCGPVRGGPGDAAIAPPSGRLSSPTLPAPERPFTAETSPAEAGAVPDQSRGRPAGERRSAPRRTPQWRRRPPIPMPAAGPGFSTSSSPPAGGRRSFSPSTPSPSGSACPFLSTSSTPSSPTSSWHSSPDGARDPGFGTIDSKRVPTSFVRRSYVLVTANRASRSTRVHSVNLLTRIQTVEGRERGESEPPGRPGFATRFVTVVARLTATGGTHCDELMRLHSTFRLF